MMLATWLIEFYLSMCNELEDVIASESVSHDVENLRVELAERQDELRQFFDTYKVSKHFTKQSLFKVTYALPDELGS